MTQPEKLLQQYFGHASFRTGQKQAIDAILSGRDVLAVMPTGAGKSALYNFHDSGRLSCKDNDLYLYIPL